MSSGNAFHQGPGVGVQGRVEQFLSSSPLYKPAGIHDVNPITSLVHDGEVVRDQDDGGSELLLSFFDEIQYLFLNGDIKCGGGFVTDE